MNIVSTKMYLTTNYSYSYLQNTDHMSWLPLCKGELVNSVCVWVYRSGYINCIRIGVNTVDYSMFREEDTLLAGAKNGNAPTIVSSKSIVVNVIHLIEWNPNIAIKTFLVVYFWHTSLWWCSSSNTFRFSLSRHLSPLFAAYNFHHFDRAHNFVQRSVAVIWNLL